MIKLGIIGTGRIAKRFVKTVCENNIQVALAAVYNPRSESAYKFAIENEISSYESDLSSFWSKVDAVYIASPHETHYSYIKQALVNDKHVLCEKPMALDEEQVKEMYALAKKKNKVLIEAIKTAYCPGFLGVIKVARSGVIGEIKDISATFTRLTPHDLREFQNREYGGSVLEFGSYVLLPIVRLLGDNYTDVYFQSIYDESGVDSFTKILFQYEDAFAEARVGLSVKSEGELIISGTKGYIYVPAPWWLTKKFEVRYEDPEKRDYFEYEYDGSGLQYEIEIFKNAIEKGICYETMALDSYAVAKIINKFLERRPKR